MLKLSLLLISFLFITGCAEVVVRPLKEKERFQEKSPEQSKEYYETDGVRFFRPHPYLWITVADKGACQMSIIWLPKMDEEYIITAKAGIGSVTMNPQLTNGWSLTSLNATVDSKASDMVTAIGNLTGNVAKAAAGKASLSSGKEFGPGLYRMVFNNGFVDDLLLVFLQGEKADKPAKCAELKPPGQ